MRRLEPERALRLQHWARAEAGRARAAPSASAALRRWRAAAATAHRSSVTTRPARDAGLPSAAIGRFKRHDARRRPGCARCTTNCSSSASASPARFIIRDLA